MPCNNQEAVEEVAAEDATDVLEVEDEVESLYPCHHWWESDDSIHPGRRAATAATATEPTILQHRQAICESECVLHVQI